MFARSPHSAHSQNCMKSRRQVSRIALVSVAAICLTGVFISSADAQEPGDRVVVTQDSALKVNNGIVATVRKGQQFEVEHINGDWLWVPLEKPGWISKRYVALVKTAKGTASARGNRESHLSGGPHAPVATALAVAVDPQPTLPPERRAVPARRSATSPRVGLSFGPHGVGVGIRDPRRGSSIMFRFGGSHQSRHRSGHRSRPHTRREPSGRRE